MRAARSPMPEPQGTRPRNDSEKLKAELSKSEAERWKLEASLAELKRRARKRLKDKAVKASIEIAKHIQKSTDLNGKIVTQHEVRIKISGKLHQKSSSS